MGRNPMADNGFPPPQYDPPVADPADRSVPGTRSARTLAWACIGVVLLVLVLLWWIGIPSETDVR